MSDTAQHLRMAEALLFAADEPLDNTSMAARLPDGVNLPALMKELSARYEGRGVTLVKVAGKWAFRTAPDLAFLLEKERTVTRRLSKAAVETLAIVAYHQPVTRAEIEEIRGVGISRGTLDMLMEVRWVRMRGRRRTPGRPVTYGTTEDFLDHFGLEGLDDLPGVEELRNSGLLRPEPPTSLFPVHDENAEPEDTEPEETEAEDGELEDTEPGDGEPDEGGGPLRVVDPPAGSDEEQEAEVQAAATGHVDNAVVPEAAMPQAVAISDEPYREAGPRRAPSRQDGLAHEDPLLAGPAESDAD